MRRRELLWLLSSTAVGLLASCQPAAPSQPPAPPPPPPPPPASPTPAPTATPSPVPPSPTAVPPSPTPPPTPRPTATPTAATPPALGAAIDAAMQRGIDQGQFPGGVALVRLRNEVILHRAYGLSYKYRSRTQLAPDPIAAGPDTLYDFASISKLFTVTCVLRLKDAGRVGLDQPVARYLPDFAANGKAEVTVRQLLTHTSGLPDYLRLWDLEPTPEARLRRVLEVSLVAPPDTVMRYSDLGLIALGHLVEQVQGASLDRVVADLVTGPLGLEQVRYRPPAELKPRIAATEDEAAVGRGMVWGEVHDENAWSLGGVAGHAGLFGPADELATLAQLYLDDGLVGGDRLLPAETVAEATRNQIGSLGARGLGWELDATYYMGRLASPQTYGHTGFTGTSLVVDPRRQLIVVLLTNRVHPTRDGPSNNPTRQAVANAALAAV